MAVIAVAAWIIASQSRSGSSGSVTRDFYTVDDGVTSFVDRANREPPFDHGGKPAVRVHYFSCDGGNTKFVGWLEQYSPEANAALDAAAAHDANANLKDLAVLTNLGWDGKPMVHRPGDERWYKRHHKEYEDIITPRAPAGTDATQLSPVEVN